MEQLELERTAITNVWHVLWSLTFACLGSLDNSAEPVVPVGVRSVRDGAAQTFQFRKFKKVSLIEKVAERDSFTRKGGFN